MIAGPFCFSGSAGILPAGSLPKGKCRGLELFVDIETFLVEHSTQ